MQKKYLRTTVFILAVGSAIASTSAFSSGIKDWAYATDDQIRTVLQKGPCEKAFHRANAYGGTTGYTHHWNNNAYSDAQCPACKAKEEWDKRHTTKK